MEFGRFNFPLTIEIISTGLFYKVQLLTHLSNTPVVGKLFTLCKTCKLGIVSSLMGRDSSVRIATTLRARRSGDRIPVETRLSTPVLTCPGEWR
jgi:hypothetical protein